jgi:eukaryotic-like serine/threonine-protein kinase
LGFIAGGKVKRVEASGGGVLELADVSVRAGAAWSRTGVILFEPRPGVFASVPATGGPVSTFLTGLAYLDWPSFLPDGRHFLFYGADRERHGIFVGELGSTETTFLTSSDFQAKYAEPGYLLFVRGETLLAQPFDATHLTLHGEPRVIAEGIWGFAGAARASFSVSSTGALAYINATLWNTQLTMVDRSGRSLGAVRPPAHVADGPQISPDGSRLAISFLTGLKPDVWIVNLSTGASARATFSADATVPLWSSDNRHFLFSATPPSSSPQLVLKDSEGDRAEKVIAMLDGASRAWDWSRDGRFVVYGQLSEQGSAELWVLPLEGDRKPYLFAQSGYHKTEAQIAPNGRWLAYTSYESGRDEVYVQSFPQPGDKRQVSTAGGMQPRWRADGKELFYLGADQNLMAVPVTTEGAFEAGSPKALFKTRLIPQGSQSVYFPTKYDVMPDGRRFVIDGPPEDPGPPITVVLNWPAALKE